MKRIFITTLIAAGLMSSGCASMTPQECRKIEAMKRFQQSPSVMWPQLVYEGRAEECAELVISGQME